MTVQDLIRELEDADPMSEVRLMTQENYPFENSLTHVIASDDISEEDDEEDESTADGYVSPEPPTGKSANLPVIYLVEGRQICYGTKAAWSN